MILPFDEAFMGYNYSRTGIKIHFKRNSLSLLKGKFYGPTAIFSLLSMLSYTIAIEKVTSNELDNQKNLFTYICSLIEGSREIGNASYTLLDIHQHLYISRCSTTSRLQLHWSLVYRYAVNDSSGHYWIQHNPGHEKVQVE